jgi:hypothetical protein
VVGLETKQVANPFIVILSAAQYIPLPLFSREMPLKVLSPAAEPFSSKILLPKNCLTLDEDCRHNFKDN